MKAPTTDGRITGLLNKGSTGHSLAGLAFSLAVISLLSVAVLAAPAGGEFLLTTNAGTGWLTSLRHAGDTNRVEFLRPSQALGAVTLRVRTPGATWREVRQSTNGVELTSRFHSHKDALLWEISVQVSGLTLALARVQSLGYSTPNRCFCSSLGFASSCGPSSVNTSRSASR